MRRFIGFIVAALAFLAFPAAAIAQDTSALSATDQVRVVRIDATGVGTPGAIAGNKVFDSIGIGYSAGAAVTQLTARTTGVTINSNAGAITLFSAAGSATAGSFTVTNSKIRATDTVLVSVKSAANLYIVLVTAVAAGSFQVTLYTTGGVAVDAPVINFAAVRSAAS